MDLILDEKLVFRNIVFKTDKEVLKFLAEQLYKNNYVKEEYIEAIQKREEEYPTGLPSNSPRIAIPHANYDLVKKTTLAIATLEKPVDFHNMENKNELISTQIVIMMAIGEPHGQIEMLQKIVGIIQDDPLRNKMIAASTEHELLNLLNKAVNNN